MLKISTVLLLAFLPVSLLAQQVAEFADKSAEVNFHEIEHPLQPMLWRARKEGLNGAAYLFGTIHLADKRITTLHPYAERAFRRADRVYTEIDFSGRSTSEAARLMLRARGTSLKTSLGRDWTRRANREIQHWYPHLSMNQFDGFSTWAFAVTLSQLDTVSGKKSLDQLLWQRAFNAQKSIKALESFQEQMGGMRSLSEPEQRKLVYQAVNEMKQARSAKKKPNYELIQYYLTGDSRALAKRYKKDAEVSPHGREFHDKLTKVMLLDRNKRIATTIGRELDLHPNKNHFFAVGTAHYIGRGNILRILQQKGFTITRVRQKTKIN